MLFVCFLLVSSPYVSLMLSVLKNILRVSPIKGVIYEKDRVRNKHHPGQEILTGYYWFLCVLSEEHSLFPLNVSTLLLVTKKNSLQVFFLGLSKNLSWLASGLLACLMFTIMTPHAPAAPKSHERRSCLFLWTRQNGFSFLKSRATL